MNHFADPDFWFHYRQLPEEIRQLADKNFTLLREGARHPSIRLKKIGFVYSARVGLHYRAIAREVAGGFSGFGLGITRPMISF